MIQDRTYQTEAVYSVLRYFDENSTGHPLVAMPTATGKAIVIARLIQLIMNYWPSQRILQLVDSKLLVEQNEKKLKQLWPMAPTGVYCAGLDLKEAAPPIVFGSLGSVRNNIEAFGHRDLILIDEAHTVSPEEETGYRQIIAGLTEINPYLRVIGFTATDYRLGQGKLTDDGFFTDVCFDITGVEAFNRLIAEGYLCPLIPKRTSTTLDVSGVSITAGEYNQGKLQKAVDKQEITYAALQEAVYYGQDRHCWLVFASGIEHSEHIAEMLMSFGISAAAVHSKLSDDEKDARIDAYKTGKLRCLVGYKMFTKGFDHPPIDFMIDLYPTASPSMHVQKNGRMTRTYDFTKDWQRIPGFDYIKKNALILDFSNNTRRLGPINDPIIPRKKGEGTGEAPIKLCEAIHDGQTCGIYNHASAKYCGGKPFPTDEGCGAEFPIKTKLLKTAGTDELIRSSEAVIETFNVSKVIYHRHQKIGSKPCIKVSYYCGIKRFTEYICPEAIGMVRTKYRNWWAQRHASDAPITTDEALLSTSQLRCPVRIKVRTDQQFDEIIGVEW